MDTLKVIVESGYSLTQEDFLSLLDELEIQSRVNSIHQLEQVTAFFMSAARALNFDELQVSHKLTKDWIVQDIERPSLQQISQGAFKF